MTKTLHDWLPSEAHQQDLPRLKKLMGLKVAVEFSPSTWADGKLSDNTDWYRWPGSHKNVFSWCILEDGSAVAWNENSATGWSFPRLGTKLVREDVVEVHMLVSKGTPEERTVYMDKHGLSVVNYRPFAGKFTRTQAEQVVKLNAEIGEPTLVVVPGVARYTMLEKGSRYARTVAEIKE